MWDVGGGWREGGRRTMRAALLEIGQQQLKKASDYKQHDVGTLEHTSEVKGLKLMNPGMLVSGLTAMI